MTTSPAFIVAPCQRSGTNWLAHILVDCGPFVFPSTDLIPGEDWLMESAALLNDYCRETLTFWRGCWQSWTLDEARLMRAHDRMLRELGAGLLRYASGGDCVTQSRLLFRTPHTRNLHLFHRLFPDAALVILVRDGRDVVASALASWPQFSFRDLVDGWATGAQHILDYLDLEGAERSHVVRYEDLYRDPAFAIQRLSTYLKLSDGDISVGRLVDLPIFGSSSTIVPGKPWRWMKEPRSDTFAPIGRWKTWRQEWQDAFYERAGAQMKALGYA